MENLFLSELSKAFSEVGRNYGQTVQQQNAAVLAFKMQLKMSEIERRERRVMQLEDSLNAMKIQGLFNLKQEQDKTNREVLLKSMDLKADRETAEIEVKRTETDPVTGATTDYNIYGEPVGGQRELGVKPSASDPEFTDFPDQGIRIARDPQTGKELYRVQIPKGLSAEQKRMLDIDDPFLYGIDFRLGVLKSSLSGLVTDKDKESFNAQIDSLLTLRAEHIGGIKPEAKTNGGDETGNESAAIVNMIQQKLSAGIFFPEILAELTSDLVRVKNMAPLDAGIEAQRYLDRAREAMPADTTGFQFMGR